CPGGRFDACGYAGWQPSPSFDSLLAKVVVSGMAAELSTVLAQADRALSEFRIDGVPTNLALLRTLVRHPDVGAYHVTTSFLDEHLGELLADGDDGRRRPWHTASAA